MTIESRLKKLEKSKSKQLSKPEGHNRLFSFLQTIYSRIEDVGVTKEWLDQQSPATAMAIAMYGPLPHPECLDLRLRQIAETTNPAGKLATIILRLAA